MKLSEVLEKYAITALNQFEFINYMVDEMDDEGEIVIEWNDSDIYETFQQRFMDQDIQIDYAVKSVFSVNTVDGERVGFIAYAPVELGS